MALFYCTISIRDKKQNVIFAEEKRILRYFEDFVSFLAENNIDYKKSKKEKMYIDDIDTGKPKEVGFIVSSWDKYDDTNKRFPKESWVSLYKMQSVLSDELPKKLIVDKMKEGF